MPSPRTSAAPQCRHRAAESGGSRRLLAIAANRATGLTELRRNLSGDLDAIVLTALDKEPARRYRTRGGISRPISGVISTAPG